MADEEDQREIARVLLAVIKEIAHTVEAECVEGLIDGNPDAEPLQVLARIVTLADDHLEDEMLAGDDEADEAPGDDEPAPAATPVPAADAPLCFTTIAQAEQAVDKALAPDKYAAETGQYLRRVADYVIEHDEVSGSIKRWLGLIGSYTGVEDRNNAIRLIDCALGHFPDNVELLGQGLEAASESGDWEAGKRYLAAAKPIPKRFWCWHLAVWACEFHKRLAACSAPDKRSDIIDAGLAIARDCRAALPLYDRIYNQEAELLLADNRVDEARRVLEEAINASQHAADGSVCTIPAAQCCLTYIDGILSNTNDYHKIIDLARRGTQVAVTEKETVEVGYFLYREALALDGSIHEDDRKVGRNSGFGNQERVREALNCYKLAYRLLTPASYRATMRKRFAILCAKSGIDDVKLED